MVNESTKSTRAAKKTKSDLKNQQSEGSQNETTYERLLRKVQENKKPAEKNKAKIHMNAKKTEGKSVTDLPTEKFVFQEQENIIELEVSKGVQRQEFPSPSEDEEDSDPEDGELSEDEAVHNNSNVDQMQLLSTVRSQSPSPGAAEMR